MEITLETLYQEQQTLHQEQQTLHQEQQTLHQELQKLGHGFEQKLAETKASIIQWVVGLFIGSIIVIGASVALATTAVMLVTR